MTDEEKSQRFGYTFVSLNVGTVTMAALYYGTKLGFTISAVIAVPLAVVAAFVVWKKYTY